ncbi:MAG TPA: ATP-binding cassette domain-containing protein, partial [Symbiobacteriaceae bacterium]|nr:ATP-binding cassette domain-containing protein [Symbiobacteriaceae bacterium]
ARLYRVPSAERERRIAEVLNLVGLTSRQHDRVGTYSGGMQRRLALARALLTRPAVVILDEPTLGVDVQSRAAIWDRIRQLARDGQTVLLTTNYMEEAQALADHLAILDHGRLIAQGTVPELRQQVGGSHIELEADMTPAQADGLRHLPGISSVSGRLPLLRMAAERGQALPVLMDYLRSEGIVPRSLTVREPDLNDVFLQLTGKGLRD